MTQTSPSLDHSLARRDVLKGAGLGVAAGLVGGLAATAQAQTTGAGLEPAADRPIWSAEYWAKKGDVALNLWRKRLGAPKAGEPPLPVLFLVHGSSNSARSSYDLTVPGKGEYSLMNVFARYGYDVWTMDHDGYGYSGSSGNNSDIASGVEDLKAAIPAVARESGQGKMHFYGTSSGAIRAGAFAQVEPARVDRLVLVAFTYKGSGAAESAGGRSRSSSTATTIAASATPP
jgi:alpha-beta hydrolase superfamily lysophospholipase